MNHLFLENLVSMSAKAAFILIPFLLILTSRIWITQPRVELSSTRKLLGVLSLVVTSLTWMFLLLLSFADRWGIRTNFFDGRWATATIFAAFSGMLLSLALKGRARIYALLAGFLMLVDWVFGIVH
jgi:hypothetical protein